MRSKAKWIVFWCLVWVLAVWVGVRYLPGQTTVTMKGQFQTTSSVKLTWTASPTPGVVSYKVFRLETGGNNNNYDLVADTVVCCVFFDQAVEAGKTYIYRLRAVDGNAQESIYSSESNAVTVP